MPLPPDVPTVTLTAQFPPLSPDGADRQGTATFTPIPPVLVDADGIYLGSENTAIGASGLNVNLVANDALDEPFIWRMDLLLDGQPPISRNISIPASAGTVTLGTVIEADPLPTDYVVVIGPRGESGDGGVPAAHAATHAAAGSDPVTPAAIGAYSASSGTALSGSVTTLQGRATALEQAQPDLPSDQNLLAWTYDPNMAGHVTAQSNAGVAGRITLTRLILRKQVTWSNIWLGLSGIDAAAVLANCYLGVYDSSGALKGSTADVSSLLMTNPVAKPFALTSSFTAAPGTYFIAMLLNGTWATNNLTFKCSGAGVSVNAGLAAPNLRYSNMLTAQTSLPSSLTLSGQTTTIITTGWASQWYGAS